MICTEQCVFEHLNSLILILSCVNLVCDQASVFFGGEGASKQLQEQKPVKMDAVEGIYVASEKFPVRMQI